MTETLAYEYSYESTQRKLSNEYQHEGREEIGIYATSEVHGK